MAVAFAYASNGQGLYAIDMRSGKEGETPRYPTPDELWKRTFAQANGWRDRFATVPFEDKGSSHPSRRYQGIAVERVLDSHRFHNLPDIYERAERYPSFGDYPPDFFDFIVIDECRHQRGLLRPATGFHRFCARAVRAGGCGGTRA